jgi:hypothetical protein
MHFGEEVRSVVHVVFIRVLQPASPPSLQLPGSKEPTGATRKLGTSPAAQSVASEGLLPAASSCCMQLWFHFGLASASLHHDSLLGLLVWLTSLHHIKPVICTG